MARFLALEILMFLLAATLLVLGLRCLLRPDELRNRMLSAYRHNPPEGESAYRMYKLGEKMVRANMSSWSVQSSGVLAIIFALVFLYLGIQCIVLAVSSPPQ